MMGPKSYPCFHTKANETVHMLNLSVVLLEEYADALQAYDRNTFRFLLAAAEAATNGHDYKPWPWAFGFVLSTQRLMNPKTVSNSNTSRW